MAMTNSDDAKVRKELALVLRHWANGINMKKLSANEALRAADLLDPPEPEPSAVEELLRAAECAIQATDGWVERLTFAIAAVRRERGEGGR